MSDFDTYHMTLILVGMSIIFVPWAWDLISEAWND